MDKRQRPTRFLPTLRSTLAPYHLPTCREVSLGRSWLQLFSTCLLDSSPAMDPERARTSFPMLSQITSAPRFPNLQTLQSFKSNFIRAYGLALKSSQALEARHSPQTLHETSLHLDTAVTSCLVSLPPFFIPTQSSLHKEAGINFLKCKSNYFSFFTSFHGFCDFQSAFQFPLKRPSCRPTCALSNHNLTSPFLYTLLLLYLVTSLNFFQLSCIMISSYFQAFAPAILSTRNVILPSISLITTLP